MILNQKISTRDQIEISLQEERITKDEKVEELEILNADFNQLSKELSAAEERLNSMCHSISDKEGQVDQRRSEKVLIEEDILNRNEKLTEARERMDAIDEEENSEDSLLDLKEQVETFEETLEANHSEQEMLEATFQEITQKKDEN